MAAYWIIINNEKVGPMSLEQVRRMDLRRDTLVWRDGLDTWRQAGFLPELADAISGTCAVPNPYIPPVPSTAGNYVAGRTPAEENAMAQANPKPPTYLAWSIVAICLCCTIPAIVALVFAARVSPRHDMGDYAGAQKASEQAELWLIISITLGIMAIPFELALL